MFQCNISEEAQCNISEDADLQKPLKHLNSILSVLNGCNTYTLIHVHSIHVILQRFFGPDEVDQAYESSTKQLRGIVIFIC